MNRTAMVNSAASDYDSDPQTTSKEYVYLDLSLTEHQWWSCRESFRNHFDPFSVFFFFLMTRHPPSSTLFPSTPLFRSGPVPEPARLCLSRRSGPDARGRARRRGVAGVGRRSRAGQRFDEPVQDRPQPSRHPVATRRDRKSTRLNSSHSQISYAVFCLKK